MKLLTRIGFTAIFIGSLAVFAAAQDNTQAESASKTAKFGSIAASDSSVKSAIDAHDLKTAASMVGKTGAFTGTVTKIYSPKSGSIVIINFDRDFKTALTAVVKKSSFSKLPDLSQLEGKKVIVTGKFIDFKGATEIDVDSPDNIKVISK
jgi:DNA/RNA endonuclease YhcR with UshA esterase domain